MTPKEKIIYADKIIAIAKRVTIIGFITTAVLLAIMLIGKGCDNKPVINPTLPIPLEATKLKEVERLTYELGIEKNRTDSLKALKPKYIRGKDRIHDSLIYVVDSTCKKAVEIMYVECLKTDSVNNNIIQGQEIQLMKYSEVVGNYKDIIVLKNYTHSVDSINAIGLNDEIKHQKKRVVKAKIGGVAYSIGGFLIGIGVGKIMP